jgi:hypothetical protein
MATEKTLQARLKRLFSNQIFVRRIGKDRLKVVDTNSLQSNGNISQTRFVDRFAGVHTFRNYNTNTYNASYNFHSSKLQLYADYEAMDLDAILASALDVYSDECTVKAANGELLVIKSENDQIKKILYNLFYDILNVDYNLWPWTRNLCKYGDFYLHLDIQEEIGIVNVSPLSVYEIRREEGFDPENPYAVRFLYEGTHKSYTNAKREHLESFEIAHFRLLSDTNFLPYGKSMIEPARKLFKQLTLMEDAMLIQRIMRAPERRIFKIDVGNIPPHEVDQHIQNIISKMKKVPFIDQQTGEYNLEYNMQNMLEDFYLPVRGSDSGTSIENLPGLGNEGQIEDIEYLRNKMMAALKIPKAFLGYDEGVEGKCISPDTKIPLINGTVKTVAEIINDFNDGTKNYVYSLNESTGEIVAGEIEWAGYTRKNAQTVKVHLDNNNFIECTPDHKFLTRDGVWVEAQYLTPNTPLMPLYLKDSGYKNHYTHVYEPGTGKYKPVHKIVAEQYNLLTPNSVVHHKDFNSRNNNPENLDCTMNFWEHRKYHQENIEKTLNSPESILKRVNDPFWRNAVREAGKKGGAKSGPLLAQWVKENGPANKKEQQYIVCKICTTAVPVAYYRKDIAKTCNNKTCKAIYMSQIQQNRVLYNDKVKHITIENLIAAASVSTSFKDLENNLSITRNTLNRVFEKYNIDKSEFIETYMPLTYTNTAFIHNYNIAEYKNHTVSHVEWTTSRIDTCDITVKTYHNFGTDAGVIIHNSTLAAEDVRFARTIERIQRIITSELTKIAIIHLYAQGFKDSELIDFEIQLTSPSIIYEKQKVDLLTTKMALAKDMTESTLFSRKYVYENIFGLTTDEWKQEQLLTVEDSKYAFRLEQIKNEGNDPAKTNMSFGTPHDIATMHIANKLYDPRLKDNVPGPGRPKESGLMGKHKDDFGRDPLAAKELTTTLRSDDSVDIKPRNTPLSVESKQYKQFISSLSNMKTDAVHNTLLTENVDIDAGTFLDETKLDNFNVI